jgi:hypothetical protein
VPKCLPSWPLAFFRSSAGGWSGAGVPRWSLERGQSSPSPGSGRRCRTGHRARKWTGSRPHGDSRTGEHARSQSTKDGGMVAWSTPAAQHLRHCTGSQVPRCICGTERQQILFLEKPRQTASYQS